MWGADQQSALDRRLTKVNRRRWLLLSVRIALISGVVLVGVAVFDENVMGERPMRTPLVTYFWLVPGCGVAAAGWALQQMDRLDEDRRRNGLPPWDERNTPPQL